MALLNSLIILVRISAIALLSVYLNATAVTATVRHLLGVSTLVESSDVIAVGRLSAANGHHTDEAGDGEIWTLVVDDFLKGHVDGQNISFVAGLPDTQLAINLTAEQYRIVFLQSGESGLRLTDPAYPALPAVAGGEILGGTPLNRVILKLAEVLTRVTSPETDLISALDALATIQDEFATDILRKKLNDTTSDLRTRIASKLLLRNDLSGLDIVETSLLRPLDVSKSLHSALAISLSGVKNPKAIPTLNRLLKTNDEEIIRGTVVALRQTRSTDALQPLSDLLSNNDEFVRYSAVVGLGEITGEDEWTPTLDEYHKHETKYLSYWHNWGMSNLSPRSEMKGQK